MIRLRVAIDKVCSKLRFKKLEANQLISVRCRWPDPRSRRGVSDMPGRNGLHAMCRSPPCGLRRGWTPHGKHATGCCEGRSWRYGRRGAGRRGLGSDPGVSGVYETSAHCGYSWSSDRPVRLSSRASCLIGRQWISRIVAGKSKKLGPRPHCSSM